MDKIEKLLTRGVAEIIKKDSLAKKLKAGKKLRVYLGIDPTAPDIHLGSSVPLRKLKEFQDLGCQVIFLIGDYTALVGDPSGKSKTRPKLSSKEIDKNAKTYLDQVGKILDVSMVEIRRNSEWYKNEGWKDVIELASKFTVSQIIERDDFEKRLKDHIKIGVHEILYPLMQAWDSVQLKADVQIGGTDQKFNILAARSLRSKLELPSQELITVQLLVGTDGKKKMSKSSGNYIGITESPDQMYGKVMSIPDEQTMSYFELCTDIDLNEVKKIDNPRDQKAKLAFEIVKMYHSGDEAKKASLEFDKVFKDKGQPSEIQELKIDKREMNIVDLLVKNDLIESSSEAKRLVEQSGVKLIINNKQLTINNIDQKIKIKKDMVLKIGKRKFYKVSK